MSVHEDRRDAKSLRIPFEAIVEIGGEVDSGGAFEAQGVDLSASGMHLRTAYLPEIGQPLLCRFGSGAQEVSAEADVVWRTEQPRGGEFGIRFTNLDGASMATLWDLCGVSPSEPEEEAVLKKSEVDPGTRVRLHIDGLGSPMKARVRGASGGELLVGSNLEFLRVGRTLELENVDRGGKRPAHIDRVDVEMDRSSQVPQLVVTLRYDDVTGEEPLPLTKVTRTSRPEEMAPARDAAPMARAETSEPISVPPVAVASKSIEPSDDDELREELEAARAMRSPVSIAATKIMPKVTELGLRAKTTMGLLMTRAMKRPGADRDAPRRTTSPPPTGALHASGKRVVRESEGDSDTARPSRAKLGTKSMIALGASVGLLAVIVSSVIHKSPAPPPGATATDVNPVPSAAAQLTEPALGATGALQANVPLFGPTPLSTTEPVPPAPLTAGGPAGATIMPGATLSATPSLEEVDDQKPTSDRARDSDSDSKHTKVAAFGHGKVAHPTVLRIKTDGEISAMHGVRLPTGFTLTVPGRRALESGSSLASRDSRIAKVVVQNGAKGSEITFQFKDGSPAYVVRAKGHDLSIALGRPGADDDDDKGDSPKRGATASKKQSDADAHHRSKKD